MGCMMEAGKLRHRIHFVDVPVESVRNDFGEEVSTETIIHECWAAVEPLAGREYFTANQTAAEISHKVTCRFTDKVKSDHTIIFGTRRFDVTSIVDVEERHKTLEIMAKERL